MMEQETERGTQRENKAWENEGGSKGRKEGGNSQFISRQNRQKGGNDESTCQLMSTVRHPSPA